MSPLLRFLRWKHHPRHGMRFSTLDGLLLLVAAAVVVATQVGSNASRDDLWPLFGWGVAFVVGHFFLFCNIFRISQTLELLWAGALIVWMAAWLFVVVPAGGGVGTFLAVQLPLTVAVLVASLMSPRYHGIGSAWWTSHPAEPPRAEPD